MVDIVFWSDGSWCYITELEDFKETQSGKYVILKPGTNEYKELTQCEDHNA